MDSDFCLQSYILILFSLFPKLILSPTLAFLDFDVGHVPAAAYNMSLTQLRMHRLGVGPWLHWCTLLLALGLGLGAGLASRLASRSV